MRIFLFIVLFFEFNYLKAQGDWYSTGVPDNKFPSFFKMGSIAGPYTLTEDCKIKVAAYIDVTQIGKYVLDPLTISTSGDTKDLSDNSLKLNTIITNTINGRADGTIKQTEYVVLFFPKGKYFFNNALSKIPNYIILKGVGTSVQKSLFTHIPNGEGTVLTFDVGNTVQECILLDGNNKGIEDMFIEQVGSAIVCNTNKKSFTINISGNNNWVRGVESYNTVKAHVLITGYSNSISSCYFHHADSYESGGYGYGVLLNNDAYFNLIENNIFEHLRHSIVLQINANHNLIFYNYSKDKYSTFCLSQVIPVEEDLGDVVFHGKRYTKNTGPYDNIVEGNFFQEIHFDITHRSNGPRNTFLRNYANYFTISTSGMAGWSREDLGLIGDKDKMVNRLTNAGSDQFQQNIIDCNMKPRKAADGITYDGKDVFDIISSLGYQSGWGWYAYDFTGWNFRYSNYSQYYGDPSFYVPYYYSKGRPPFLPSWWTNWPHNPDNANANWAKNRYDNPQSYSRAEKSNWNNYECEYATDLKISNVSIDRTKNYVGVKTATLESVIVQSSSELSVGAKDHISVKTGTSFKSGSHVRLYIDADAANKYNIDKRFACESTSKGEDLTFNEYIPNNNSRGIDYKEDLIFDEQNYSDTTSLIYRNQDSLMLNNINSLKIYPNPVTIVLEGVLTEDFTETVTYKIQDYSGQEILSGLIKSKIFTINVFTLPKGFYNILINTSKNNYTRSFIKQ